MRIGPPRTTIDATLWISTTFAVLVGSRVLSLVVPTEFYFNFEALFTDRAPRHMAIAVFGKMANPLIVGFAIGWLLHRSARHSEGISRRATLSRRLHQRWLPSVFLGSFFAAFLSAWPMIVYWDMLANPDVAYLKPIFFVLYLLYMFAFGYVALLGLLAAIFVREHTEARSEDETRKLVSVGELSRVGGLWLVNSGIASGVLQSLTK